MLQFENEGNRTAITPTSCVIPFEIQSDPVCLPWINYFVNGDIEIKLKPYS